MNNNASPFALNHLGSRGTSDSAHDDPRLCAAIEDYLRACESGRAPNVETFVQQYAEFGDELRDCLAGLALVRHAAPEVTHAPATNDLVPSQVTEPIGDFRILREVGRGGMGVVYEAEQISLSRRVALKILPFAAVLDPRHLQRFKNEAMAAAHLDHPNIVEVYGIGCERSIHFYAMRFIEGVTLADVVEAKRRSQAGTAEVRNPTVDSKSNDEARTEVFSHSSDASLSTPHASLAAETSPVLQAALSTVNSITPKERFRRIAEIGIQAAEALDHAHQMGIVHRDIKPSNLMLDERGKLWVTDFGLARNQGDASMTMTGDLVGTLRYMSPEQALAKRITVDDRTDIYSLGVTLYELLTLRAAFPSSDREETLRQIAFEEPKSPRKLDKSIPEELETIILKAMEKNPDDRYATARDVAEDLRRWVEHKPIVARAPGILKKSMKLGHRHKGILLTAIGGLMLVMCVLVGAVVLLQSAYENERQQRQLADIEADISRKSVGNALDAIDRALARLGAKELRQYPGTEQLRQDLVQDAISVREQLIQDTGDSSAKTKAASLNLLLSNLKRASGDPESAITLDERAKTMYAQIVAQCEREPQLAPTISKQLHLELEDDILRGSLNVAKANTLVSLLPILRKLPASENLFFDECRAAAGLPYCDLTVEQKRAYLRDLVEQSHHFEKDLFKYDLSMATAIGGVNKWLADLEQAENPALAAAHYSVAAQVNENAFHKTQNPSLAIDVSMYLMSQARMSDMDGRESLIIKAIGLSDGASGVQNSARRELAHLFLMQDRLPEAETVARQSVEYYSSAMQGRSGREVNHAGWDLVACGSSHETLAEILELKGDAAAAMGLYDSEIARWKQLAQRLEPPDQFATLELVRAELALGACAFLQGNRKKATDAFRMAFEDLRAITKTAAQYEDGLGELRGELAYQLLMSPAVKWRNAEEAKSLLHAIQYEVATPQDFRTVAGGG